MSFAHKSTRKNNEEWNEWAQCGWMNFKMEVVECENEWIWREWWKKDFLYGWYCIDSEYEYMNE